MSVFTGLLESPPDPRDWDFENSPLYGGISVSRKSITTAGDEHVERDQYSQSCVHYTLAQAIQDLDRQIVRLRVPVREAIVRTDGGLVLESDGTAALAEAPTVRRAVLPLLAPMFSYALGRLLWFRATGEAVPAEGLPDTGSSYRYGIMALRDVENGGGSREDATYPDVPSNARRLPPAHVDQADPLVKVGGYYRIKGEGRENTLRDGITSALLGYLEGRCSKPCGSMLVTEGFVNTPEGAVYDARNPGKPVGGHAMLIQGYDADNDAVVFHQTWEGRPRTYRVRISDLATPGVGGETWVLKNLIYIPRT